MNFKKRNDILRSKRRNFFRSNRKQLFDPPLLSNREDFLSVPVNKIRNQILIWDEESKQKLEENQKENQKEKEKQPLKKLHWIYWANFVKPEKRKKQEKKDLKKEKDLSSESSSDSDETVNKSNLKSVSDTEQFAELSPEILDQKRGNMSPEMVNGELEQLDPPSLEILEAINPNKLHHLDFKKLNNHMDGKAVAKINFKKLDRSAYLKVLDDLGPETWIDKGPEIDQLFHFKSMHLKIVSPTTIRMWTVRRSLRGFHFTPALIQPHLTSSSNPEQGLIPAYLVGNSYKDSDQLWNPRAEGSLSDDYWYEYLKKDLTPLALEMGAFHHVMTAQTVNYKTLEPVTNGLFCTRIFGKRVENGLNKRRRYQLGYIRLGTPCAHIWYLKARPNYLSVLLNMKKKIIQMLAYYKGVGAFPFSTLGSQFRQTATETLFRNRNKNRHHCQKNTFWLNHTVGFNALKHSLFDMFIHNWGFLTFFGLEKQKQNSPKNWLFFAPHLNDDQKKGSLDPTFGPLVFQNWAWEELSTRETLGENVDQDPVFWSKPWVSFFSSHTDWRQHSGKQPNKMWQQQTLIETNKKLNKSLSLFQKRPNFFDEISQLGTFFVFGIVFNTIQSGFDIQVNKSAVIVTSCSRKFDPFIQKEVYSNYSPALKAFFNYVWSNEKLNNPYKKQTNPHLLPGYKSAWVPKKTGLKPISYKKEMAFATFQQGLNDDDKLAQVKNDQQFFQCTRWIIYSQLIHWNAHPKKRDDLQKLDDFQSFLFLSNDEEKRTLSGFRWLSINWVPNFQTFKGTKPSTTSTTSTVLPVSLYTRLLEITPEAQVKNLFLLPFFDRYAHIQRYSIDSRWVGMIEQLRLSGPFNMPTQKKQNPLGTSTFRTFLKQFFQLSCKKNGLVALMKKSKPILLSYIMHSHGLNIEKRANKNHLNQLDHEKQKCIYHFLNQLILPENVLFKNALKTTNRLTAFILKQRQMLEKVEPKVKVFSSSTLLLDRLSNHPFCYFLFNTSFRRRSVLPLLNPFSLKEKVFFARYLQTFRGPCYQSYYNFICLYYGFEPKNQKKDSLLVSIGSNKKLKRKPNKVKAFVWKKTIKKRKTVWLNFPFEVTASYFEQSLDKSLRSDRLEKYFTNRKDLRRNTFGVVPTRFVFRTSFRFVEEEWAKFEEYIESDSVYSVFLPDVYVPSYIERVFFRDTKGARLGEDSNECHPMYNRGGDAMRAMLRRYSQIDQVFTYSFAEIEENKRRRALNEPFIFSYDHEPVFHERNVSMQPERVTPPIYYQTQLVPACGRFVDWLKREIQYADSTIYKFEQLLPSGHVKRLNIGSLNLSKWEIPVEDRFAEYKDFRPEPYNVRQYFTRVATASSQRFYQRQMYVALVKLRRRRFKMIRRFKTLAPFLRKPQIRPEWMMIEILPVLPPDLRPILTFGDQMIVSDLTKLYQQVIYRNDRCFGDQVADYFARLLQEAVDALMENGKGNAPAVVSSSTEQPLKSLSDVLKGKKGRFRQNLLGKRVDYSGRSVIVVGPKLGIYECGLPKQMALELFKPFVLRELYKKKLARHAFAAKKLLNSKQPVIWELLRQVMESRPVLLNRAPTLHRLGMQAFRPKLVSGRAILLHPLVCSGYNADFDGDQMAVHIPLTTAACSEAWRLMWSRNNLLSPATGDPTLLPSQDMILGCYYLTSMDVMHRTQQLQKALNVNGNPQHKVNNFTFQSIDQLLRLVQMQILDYHSVVWLRWPYEFEFEQKKQRCIEIQIDPNGNIIKIYPDYKIYDHMQSSRPTYFIKTTPGRALINQSIWDSLK